MYAKLFRDVLTSSLNETEPVEVRGVFFLMMAAADKDGNVLGSDQTIARIINVPTEQFSRCLDALKKPDPHSRCELYDGRRVVPMESGLGYLLPAYPKYSGIKTDEERREYFRVKKAESRERIAASGGQSKETPAKPAAAEPVGPQQDPLEIPENLKTPLFANKWQVWMNQRRSHHKVKDWVAYFREQLDWLAEMGPDRAVATLTQGILGNHQGLFQVNGNGSKPKELRGGTMAKPGENF